MHIDIGKNIKEIRTSKGLSQSDICPDNIERSYISHIESGKKMPSYPILIDIAKKIKFNPRHLIKDHSQIYDVQPTILEFEIAKNDFSNVDYIIEKINDKENLEYDPLLIKFLEVQKNNRLDLIFLTELEKIIDVDKLLKSNNISNLEMIGILQIIQSYYLINKDHKKFLDYCLKIEKTPLKFYNYLIKIRLYMTLAYAHILYDDYPEAKFYLNKATEIKKNYLSAFHDAEFYLLKAIIERVSNQDIGTSDFYANLAIQLMIENEQELSLYIAKKVQNKFNFSLYSYINQKLDSIEIK